MRLSFIPVLVSSLTVGCVRQPLESPYEASQALVEPAAFPHGPVLQGFDASWRTRPHRLRALTVRTPDASGVEPGLRSVSLLGGAWASGEKAFDTSRVRVAVVDPSDWGALAVTGSVHVDARGSVRGRPDAAAGSSLGVVSGVACEGHGAWVSVLRGFSFAAHPSHPDGFTVRGLHVMLGEPACVASRVVFPVDVEFSGGPVPDRAQRLALYGASIQVDYALYRVPVGSSSRVEVRSRSGRRGTSVRAVRGLKIDTPSLVERAVRGVALSGFRFRAERDRGVPGRYLRAISVDFDAASSAVWLRFTNAGPIARPTIVTAAAQFSVITDGPVVATSNSTGRWSESAAVPSRITR